MPEQEQPLGLMMATMEPPAPMEDEFQDWYDTEHFPERANCDGFLTAGRFTCLDGWPRYIALYDLADTEVLQRPGYLAVAGSRYSPWTQRIMPRMWGTYRAAGPQVYPGRALFGGQGRASRVVMWRFRSAPADQQGKILEGLRAIYEGKPQVAQLRLFRSEQADGIDFIGLVELHVPFGVKDEGLAALGAAARYVDAVNTYTAYRRRAPGGFPFPGAPTS